MGLPAYEHSRYFVTYSGIKLPLKLVNPLEPDETENRNTFFCAYYDSDDRMVACEKKVYGEVELRHTYEYHTSGNLKSALVEMAGEEPQQIDFPE